MYDNEVEAKIARGQEQARAIVDLCGEPPSTGPIQEAARLCRCRLVAICTCAGYPHDFDCAAR